MNVTTKVLLVVGVAWIALSPPLFTGGACTAEFDQETRRLDQDPKALRTPAAARAYFTERSVPFNVITTEQCRKAKPHMSPFKSLPLPLGWGSIDWAR